MTIYGRFLVDLNPAIARAALKDITIVLQAQVITNLKVQEDTNVDFTALQDVSDSSQDKAIFGSDATATANHYFRTHR